MKIKVDLSAKYKNLANSSDKIQNLWKPEIGDFWHCNCNSCINHENRAWILEQADVLCIDPDVDLRNYYRDVQMAATTSIDCGFGAYWRNWKECNQRGFVWLPKFDQIIKLVSDKMYEAEDQRYAFNAFTAWWHGANPMYDTIEQAALTWLIMGLNDHI